MAEPLKNRIRKLRETLGLTQVEFAELIRKETGIKGGPHPSTIARWEKGTTVPGGVYIEALDAIAKNAGLRGLFDSFRQT
jgi:transcriptional regulator with XRE-family HTH domain